MGNQFTNIFSNYKLERVNFFGDGVLSLLFCLIKFEGGKTTDRKRSKYEFAWKFLPYLYTKYVSFTSEYFSENTSLI
jgi:hypothetical protein